MADKIVQLIDKDNNNIYPVAGSMADDSIMTAMLKDGSVTPAKVASNAITANKLAPDTANSLFTKYYASDIPANADLNTITYCQPGVFVCSTTAGVATLTNCPTWQAFRMEVYNMTRANTQILPTTNWWYLVRKILDLEGHEWVQQVASNGSTPPVWTYGPWRETGQTITMTTTDPGEGSALGAGQFIAVY
jgi:hypothetical protein